MRILTFAEAIKEALDIELGRDPSVYLMGLGVPDPKGVFGTTLDLQRKHGEDRVLDMPTAENGMTGIAIGSAIVGKRPILTHQRLDFALLTMEQIVNQAAKWNYMFGGKANVPLVIRLIIGRGWGQGPQHSQNIQSWFTHVPGLKVVMPTSPHDAKGLMIASIRDNNPVIFLEHRWLHNINGDVPEGDYTVELEKCKIVEEGNDITILTNGYMTLESIKAREYLLEHGINAEIIDVRTLAPLDMETIFTSVKKTGRVITATGDWKSWGYGSEVISRICEELFSDLKSPPARVALPDLPTPTSHALSQHYYPKANKIANVVGKMFNKNINIKEERASTELDVPDKSFTGPF